jgi:gluconate 5-dehydrogenase
VVTDPFDLTDQVAIVIGGAAGGLGERAARILSERGAVVSIADLPGRDEELQSTAATCAGKTTVHTCDVTDEASVAALFAEVLSAFGRIDIVVNTAGVMLRKNYDETTVPEFRHVVDVNLVGTWLVGREAGRHMASRGGGRIVNLSTVYAERVGPLPESAYYASKAGVANVTRALAAELGPAGVNVNCLAPAVFYPTAMTAPLKQQPERLRWFADRTMLGRLGDPDRDLAGPLLLLASPASSYMTGQVIYLDGGWSAW